MSEDSKTPESGPHLEHVATLSGHTDRVWCCAWNPSGSLLATSSGDKTIRIWGLEGDKWISKSTLDGVHERTIRSLAWSPNGKFLASCSFDGTTAIYVKGNTDFECTATLEGHDNEVKGVAWDASGSLLATSSRDKSVWIWEAESDGDFECLSVLHGHTQDVKSVLWHPTNEVLLSASYDDTLKIWKGDDDDWFCSQTLEGHTSTVWQASFETGGQRLVSCSDDKTLIVWECDKPERDEGWAPVSTIRDQHERTIFSVDWSKQGVIASGAGDDCIRLFSEDPKSRNSFSLLSCQQKAHDADVNCVAWNPSNTYAEKPLLASASDDNVVKLWQLIK